MLDNDLTKYMMNSIVFLWGPNFEVAFFCILCFFFPLPQTGLFPHVRWLILMNPRRGGEVQLWINMPTQDLDDHTKTCLGCSSMIITEKSCKVQTNDWPRCFLCFFPAEVYCTDVCWQKHQVLCSIFGIGHLGESQLNHSGNAASTLSWGWANDKSMICWWTGIPSVIQYTESIKRVFFTWLSCTFFWSIKMFWCKLKSLWNFERSCHIAAIKECTTCDVVTCDVLPGVLTGDRIEATNITSWQWKSLEDQDGKSTPLPTRLSHGHIGEIPEGWRCHGDVHGVSGTGTFGYKHGVLWIQKMIPDVFSAMECMASPSRLGAANKACQKLQKRSVKKGWKRTKWYYKMTFETCCPLKRDQYMDWWTSLKIKVRFCSEDASGQFVASEDASMIFL